MDFSPSKYPMEKHVKETKAPFTRKRGRQDKVIRKKTPSPKKKRARVVPTLKRKKATSPITTTKKPKLSPTLKNKKMTSPTKPKTTKKKTPSPMNISPS